MLRRGLVGIAVVGAAGAATWSITSADVTPVPVVDPPPGGGAVEYHEFLIGPYEFDEAGGAYWQEEASEPIPRPPGEYAVVSVVFDLVDENGDPHAVEDAHIHHFVAGAAFESDPLCDRTYWFGGTPVEVRPIFGTGQERTPIAFPDSYGLWVPETQIWGATWHVMNVSPQPITAYIRYTVGIQRGATAENTRLVTPYFLDVDHDNGSCGNGAWDVPGDGGPGSTYTESDSWVIPDEGIVVGIGGHLHEGGLYNDHRDSDGDLICRSTVEYLQSGFIGSITPCLMHSRIDAGETVTLDAVYDNSTDWQDVMGISMMFVWHGQQPDPPPTTTTSVPVATVPVPVTVPGDYPG